MRAIRITKDLGRPLAEGTGVLVLPDEVTPEDALGVAQDALSRVRLGPWAPFAVQLQAVGQRYLSGAWGIRLVATAVVKDRDTGVPLDVVTWVEVNPACVTGEFVVQSAIDLIRKLYFHELEENILIGGVRVFDPHKHETTGGVE